MIAATIATAVVLVLAVFTTALTYLIVTTSDKVFVYALVMLIAAVTITGVITALTIVISKE